MGRIERYRAGIAYPSQPRRKPALGAVPVQHLHAEPSGKGTDL
jgi:hypothetical protein